MEVISAVDFPVLDKLNAIGGAFIVVATYIFGEHWVLFAAFLVLNFFDCVTGIIKSRVLKTESSSAGLRGIVKKLSYWIMILIAFGMGPVFNEIGEAIGVDLSMLTPWIGWLILATFIMNELRSILENLVQAGVAVPAVLTRTLKVMQRGIDAAEEKIDGILDINHTDQNDEYHVNLDTPVEDLEEKDVVVLKIHTINKED